MKIRILSKEHSTEVQELFIKEGWKWSDQNTGKVQLIEMSYLWIDDDMLFAHSDNENFFEQDDTPEIRLLHPKQKIFLQGILYADESVLNTLKNGYYNVSDADLLNSLLV